MLLFILLHPFLLPSNQYFNTSHVTVYQGLSVINKQCLLISIHLMLLFIKEGLCISCRRKTFQYISCYCLSAADYAAPFYKEIFQYISCYCLSRGQLLTEPIKTIFQYISCYCLSFTSYLWSSHRSNFNTSHVTVYQIQPPIQELTLPFQYISCYCLSIPASVVLETFCISIHLMLLFIGYKEEDGCKFSNFNTSHVTVYQCEDKIRLKVLTFQYISCYCLSSCDPAMCKGI